MWFRKKVSEKIPRNHSSSTTDIHKLVNKARSTGSLLDKKAVKQSRVLTEELDEIGAMLEHTPMKSQRRLAQETTISKSSAAKAMKLLKLRLYKATVVHALQPRDPASRINFWNWFMQSLHDEVDPHLIFLLMKCGFICTDMFPPTIIDTGV
jgi:hypothetical protein